jgi:hypothetical protein
MSVVPNPQFNFDSLTFCPTSKGTFSPAGIKVLLVGSAFTNDAEASSNRKSEIKKSRKVGFGVEESEAALDRWFLLLLVVVAIAYLFVSGSMT